jgi:ABC-type dipeptide/oligopeptide/nickel transport system ATPase component
MFARRDQVVFAESGTNEWIWSFPPYVQWVSEQSSVLWIQGKPGSGKSVLAKTTLSRLTSGPAALSAHSCHVTGTSSLIGSWFYSWRGGDEGTSHVSMLRSILYQLLDQDRSLFPYFRDSYRRSDWDPSNYSWLQEILMKFTREGSNASNRFYY